MAFRNLPNLRPSQHSGVYPDFTNSFCGNILSILLMIGGIAMPSSLVAYEFRYENLGCVILSESEIVRDAL